MTQSGKSSVGDSRASGRSLTKLTNRIGHFTELCGTPLRIETAPESFPPTCTLEARPVRCTSIHRTTASQRPRNFNLVKSNLCLLALICHKPFWSINSPTKRSCKSTKAASPFQPGGQVWHRNSSPKFDRHWTGPFTIIQCFPNKVYCIK